MACFAHITKALLATAQIAAVATSATGRCMLPVDANARPPMRVDPYGIDTSTPRQTCDAGKKCPVAQKRNAAYHRHLIRIVLWQAQR